MAGLAAVAAETLRSDRVRFKPALAMNETAGWSLRDDALSEAHGVVRWLFTILDADPTTDLRTLHEMAARAVGAHVDT